MKVAFPASVQKGIIVPHPAYAGKAAVAFSRLKVGETVTVTAEFAKLQDLAEKLLNENGIYLQADERF